MDSKEYITSGHIEAYVMGLCTPQEKAEAEAMRLQYPEVNEAIVAFEQALEKEFTTNPSSTNAALDAKILHSLNALQATELHTVQAPVKRINWLKLAAAAAVVLLIGSSILNYTLYNKTKEQELALAGKQNETSLPVTDYNILKNPAITPVAMYGVGIHAVCRCTLFWDKKTNKAYIMIHHLATPPPNTNYQLWANINGQQVSVGLLNDKIRDRFIEMPNIPKEATGFSVTLEKEGGSTTPTENETYLVGRI